MPLRVMIMFYVLVSLNFTGICLSKFSQWTLGQNLGCRHMALTVKSSPFCKFFEIFHLESLRLGWWAGLEAAVCSTDGEELPSHRLEATMGQITGLEKALPTFSVEEKTHWSGCVLLLPEGPVQGVLLLSAGQAPRELSPHLPSLLPAVGSILRGPWHVPKLSSLSVKVYFKTSYYRWSDWLLAIANFCKRLSDSENCLFHVQVRVTKTRKESVRQLGSQHIW